MLRVTRFPYDYKATHFLASPQLQTPWLVFQDEWHNTSQNKKVSNVTKRNLNKNHSFHAMPGCHHLVSGTFHPLIKGFFSAFPRGTKYTIGLEKYLELEVDASQKRFTPNFQWTLLKKKWYDQNTPNLRDYHPLRLKYSNNN